MATGDDKYLRSARDLIDFFKRCADDHMSCQTNLKVSVAAALLYQCTGETVYRKLAIDIGDFLASLQHGDGTWTVPGDLPEDLAEYLRQDLTNELVVWLRDIDLAV